MSWRTTRAPRRAGHEHGFTIVEVLIAMLLLVAIASGVALAFASGSRLEQKRDLTSRMTAASERVYEHLRSNKDWIAACRRPSPSSPPSTCRPFERLSARERNELGDDDILKTRFVISSIAQGIDNSGDGLRGADQDGNADDFFQIRITVEVAPRDVARLGKRSPMSVTSIINGSTNTESGALVVMFCGAANQVDERIQIASCPQRYTWFDMPDCAGTPNCSPRSLFPATPPQSALTASRMVAVEPVRVPRGSIRLVKRGGEDNGRVYDGTASVEVAPAVYRFSDLPTGTYAVASYGAGGWVDWGTHHIPSTKEATVERQRTAIALIALKRPGASGAFRMKFDREVRERFLAANEKTFTTPWIPECEQPASFNRNAFFATTVTCNNATGHMRISMVGGGSATANMEGLGNDSSQYDSTGAFREHITVKYIGEVRREEYIWNGAAGPGLFSTQPAPAGRYTERSRSGTNEASYTIPLERWKQAIQAAPYWDDAGSAANTTAAGIGTGQIAQVPLGLNDGIDNERDSRIGNVFQKYSPAGCDRRYMWIRPDSGFGSCSSLHWRGDRDECYTTLDRNWTGYSYRRHRGCSRFYWPPMGLIANPGRYLVLQVCRVRESRITNIRDQHLAGYDNSYTSEEDWSAGMKDSGYGIFEAGSHTVAGRTVASLRAYKEERPYDQTRPFNLGCMTSPSPDQPRVCNQLDEWASCDRAIQVQIPKTPGWGTSGDVQDGHRPPRAGTGMSALSA